MRKAKKPAKPKAKPKPKPVRRARRRNGPDLASMPIAELRRELERRCALRDGAPLPEEIRRLAAAERDRALRSCGVYVEIESLDLAGFAGDYLRYAVVLLVSGPLERSDLKQAFATLERPLPDSDSEPETKVTLRRFRKGA